MATKLTTASAALFPQLAPSLSPRDTSRSRRTRFGPINDRTPPLPPSSALRCSYYPFSRRRLEVSKGGGGGGGVGLSVNNARVLRRCKSVSGGGSDCAVAFSSLDCCSLRRRRSRVNRIVPGAFLDKSAFRFHGYSVDASSAKIVHVPRASVGPNEPHAASMVCPDGILERQDTDLLYPQDGTTPLAGFLSSALPTHPKLCRGQLKNGLRYLILPNKVPPNSVLSTVISNKGVHQTRKIEPQRPFDPPQYCPLSPPPVTQLFSSYYIAIPAVLTLFSISLSFCCGI